MDDLLISLCCVLVFTGLAAVIPSVHQALTNSGAHGFSEILYAYISRANNNGSAFAGLLANNDYLNITIALSMLIDRFGIIFTVLILAGSLVKKKRSLQMSEISSLDTTSFIFAILVFFTTIDWWFDNIPSLRFRTNIRSIKSKFLIGENYEYKKIS